MPPLANHQFKTEPRLSTSLQRELAWLGAQMTMAIAAWFGQKGPASLQPPPDLSGHADACATFILDRGLQPADRLLLMLALAPQLSPSFLDDTIGQALGQAGDFPQLGGVKGKAFRGFLPTVETALFLLAGRDVEARLQWLGRLPALPVFRTALRRGEVPTGEPPTAAVLSVLPDCAELLLTGRARHPEPGPDFPAQYISTELEWSDLVIPETTARQIANLKKWLTWHPRLLQKWNMKLRVAPGYRALFHGPPGTGKTLTAKLLGKHTGRQVFRVDLSTVVSKYIGETEKHLASLFDKAEHKGWILFFDEADALFGKRTAVKDAHDRFANQEVSFLLQRTESFDGMVILASNYKQNMDDAFARRFQSHIYFPPPKYAERLLLWQKAIPRQVTLEKAIDLPQLARKYELTGSNIVNVMQFACIEALARDGSALLLADLVEGIENEFYKEGKIA